MEILPQLISQAQEAKWNEILSRTRKAVVTAHISPDGDAIGSCLGLNGYLRRQGVDSTVVLPDELPDYLMWLEGVGDVVFHDSDAETAERLVAEADTVFCLDFNDFSRAGKLGGAVESSAALKVCIDHHLSPVMQADLMVSRPEMCSTCEVVFRLLWQLDAFEGMTTAEAVSIYCGMMTDTGGFTYNSSRPEIFFIISCLLTKNFDKDKIYRNVFNNYTQSRIRIMGYLLYTKLKFYPGLHACYYTLTGEEMGRFHFHKGDAEGLVNIPLTVKGTRLSAAFREDTEARKIRVSLRSVDDFPCNKMAEEFFNGGGHLNAAGGELSCTMEEAVKVMDRAVQAYAHLL